MGNSGSGFSNHSKGDDFTGEIRRKSAVTSELCQMLIDKSKNHNVGEDHISRKTFLRYFNSEKVPEFAPLLYDHVSEECDNSQPECATPLFISGEAFSKFCKEIVTLLRDSEQMKFYLTLFAHNKHSIDRRGIEDLFRACFLLEAEMVGSKYACDPDNPLLISVVEAVSLACVHQEKSIGFESLQTFLRKYFPKVIHSGVHRWLVKKIGTVQSFPSNDLQTDSNGTKTKCGLGHGNQSSCSLNSHRNEGNNELLHPVLVWFFAHSLPGLYTKPKQMKLPSPVTSVGQCLFDYHEVLTSLMKYSGMLEWELLYSNSSHGSSINRFQHHVFSYRGPTAMLVKTDGDVMLCVAIDQEWRERVSRWGGEKCIVMQITPCFKIFEAGEKLIYFNLTTRGYPFGLHVGHNPKSPVLEIDQDLCVAKVKKIPYKLEILEIWGCADKEIREKQIEQKKWEIDQAEKQKKVNRKAVDWNENPDRYILELAGRPSYGANFKR